MKRLLTLALVAGSLGSSRPAHAQTLSLPDAVSAALEAHPSLAASRARIEAADEGAAAARSTRLPGVAVSASMNRFQEPMIVAPLHAFDPTRPPRFDQTLVQAQAGATYTLFDSGARGARIAGAAAVADATRLGHVASEMALLESVSAAYLGILTARALQGAASRQVAAVESEVARARQHLEAGTAAEVEALRADAALQDARAQHASATARVGLAERSLARLMGLPDDDLAGQPLVEIASISTSPEAGPGANPLLGRARRAIAASEARASEQRAGRLPRLDVGAGLLDFGTLDDGHVVEWQVGLQLSWPVFTGGARSAAVRRADAEVRASREDAEVIELELRSAIDAASSVAADADARAEALIASVERWTEVARIEALAIEAGSGTQSDLLRAEAALFQARSGRIRAQHDAILARISLARAQGVLDTRWLTETLETR